MITIISDCIISTTTSNGSGVLIDDGLASKLLNPFIARDAVPQTPIGFSQLS